MNSAAAIALAITIFGAFAYAAASILQAVGARRSVNTVRTLGHPLYLIGSVLDIAAWVGSMVALGTLAVYLVESVLAGSLALTVLGARIFLGSHLRRRDVAAVAVSIAALTVLAMSAGPQENVPATTQLRLGFCAAALILIGLGVLAAHTATPGVVAAVAGLCLGGAAVTGRALPIPDAPGTLGMITGLLAEPLTWALLGFGLSGMLLYAHALQKGQVGPVTAVLWIAEVTAPSAVALGLLGDTVRPGWETAATGAALVTVCAAVVLATAPAADDTTRIQEEILATVRPVWSRVTATASRRFVWWGAPPVWTPPPRAGAQALTAAPQPRAELTWSPPQVQPLWADPQPADSDALPAHPGPVGRPEPVSRAHPVPAQAYPWEAPVTRRQ
ncbi:hypothetical protein [Actinoplanes sp. N902-109]|uniref:hypothetical protein n=1 Tax=Actinoplanes sp. (strain N902-109) TaxID=649831 RepID=UPI0003296457|nr:hypothetical protein [Actinoplanes sp. N902-109]AGL18059.1 integral membrane protein [Actinoplanes sp. N902-109]